MTPPPSFKSPFITCVETEEKKLDPHRYLSSIENEIETMVTVHHSTEQEENLKVEQLLLTYLSALYGYLEDRFNSTEKLDACLIIDLNELSEHLSKLKNLLDHKKNNAFFVCHCLMQIDLFLSHIVLRSSSTPWFGENKKKHLMGLQALFPIIDQHYTVFEEFYPKHAVRLKIKLANLPLADDVKRKGFKNIYLSEQEQRMMLIGHFQRLEDQAVLELIERIKIKSRNMLDMKSAKKLGKLLDQDCQRLSLSNQERLKEALIRYLGLPVKQKSLTDSLLSQTELMEYSIKCPTPIPYLSKSMPIGLVYLASKAKSFFKNLPGIPRWYHATRKTENFQSIIHSGCVELGPQLKQVWFSAGWEKSYGDYVFVFNHSIKEIANCYHSHGYTQEQRKRWRAIHTQLPFIKDKTHLQWIGIPPTIGKEDKLKIREDLKAKGIDNPKVFYNYFVEFVSDEFTHLLGCPNLSEKWW